MREDGGASLPFLMTIDDESKEDTLPHVAIVLHNYTEFSQKMQIILHSFHRTDILILQIASIQKNDTPFGGRKKDRGAVFFSVFPFFSGAARYGAASFPHAPSKGRCRARKWKCAVFR